MKNSLVPEVDKIEVKISKPGDYCISCMKPNSSYDLFIRYQNRQGTVIPLCLECLEQVGLAILSKVQEEKEEYLPIGQISKTLSRGTTKWSQDKTIFTRLDDPYNPDLDLYCCEKCGSVVDLTWLQAHEGNLPNVCPFCGRVIEK